MYYNEFLSLLGERIRALRKEKNIKQEKLAELVDKATEHISFIERGERAPSLELLLDLARVLNVPLPYLMLQRLNSTVRSQYQHRFPLPPFLSQ
jgi:transcriptional regulator with XRE-family HTH domain